MASSNTARICINNTINEDRCLSGCNISEFIFNFSQDCSDFINYNKKFIESCYINTYLYPNPSSYNINCMESHSLPVILNYYSNKFCTSCYVINSNGFIAYTGFIVILIILTSLSALICCSGNIYFLYKNYIGPIRRDNEELLLNA
jgi:hypothetical protein